MKIVLQRVLEASVNIHAREVSKTRLGCLLLVGISATDTQKEIDYLVDKVLNLRIFENLEGKFDRSISDIRGDIMVVSQFTLFADTSKGRRPSFLDAAPSDIAEPIFNKFVESLRLAYPEGYIQTGEFGKDMKVSLINDGPVTLILEK